MKVRVQIFGSKAVADLAFPTDLSRSVRFQRPDDKDTGDLNPEGLRAFGLPAATATAVSGDGYTLDVERGGSVNCSTLSFTPHGNGTHTECVGHIVEDRVSVNDFVPLVPLLAWVLTVAPGTLAKCGEDYRGKSEADDPVVSAESLHRAAQADDDFIEGQPDLDALILRTVARGDPLDAERPPYLTDDAVAWLHEHDIHHILVDTPSIDRLDDGGVLSAHRAFFGLELGQTRLESHQPRRTVTELIAVPDNLPDGPVLLLLEVAPLDADAAPSRPVVFSLDFLSD